MEESEKYRMTGALEAVLFAMGEAVECTTLAKALDTDLVTILEVIEELRQIYDDAGRGITLLEIDGKVQLCTKPCYYDNLIRIASMPEKPTLSNTLMETLAIVAYKQPVTKAEITKIRGVSSDHAVNRLVEFGLIQEAGRLNAPGRPILFATTEEFLRRFGMNSLDNLPIPEKDEERMEESLQEEIPEGALIMEEDNPDQPGEETETQTELVEEMEVRTESGEETETYVEKLDTDFVMDGQDVFYGDSGDTSQEEESPSKAPLNLDELTELEDFDDLDTEDLLNALSLMEKEQGEDYMDFLSDSSDEDDDYMA